MPWIAVLLRGTKVFARCDAAGALIDEQGKVEIRYRQQDAKAYRALAQNLLAVAGHKVWPDEHCGEAAPAPKSEAGAPAAPARAKKKAAGASHHVAPSSGEHVVAYTDGACSGNPGPAGLGVVLIDGQARRELSEYLGVATNNIAELTAILRAVEALEGDLPLVIHTDSQYAIGVLTKNWKPKANQELIQRIKECMRSVKRLSFVYVPGHAGVPLNERADALARAAVVARGSSGWQRARELTGAGA